MNYFWKMFSAVIFVLTAALAYGCADFTEISVIKGSPDYKNTTEYLEFKADIENDSEIHGVRPFSGQLPEWTVEIDLTYSSEYLRQHAGIYVGDEQHWVKVVVGRLILQGSEFNVGMFNEAEVGNKNLLPEFKTGDKVTLILTKSGDKLFGGYRFKDSIGVIGSFPAEAAGKMNRAGVLMCDPSAKRRTQRIKPGLVPAATARFYRFAHTPHADSKILELRQKQNVFMRLRVHDIFPAPAFAVATIQPMAHSKSAQFGIGAKSGTIMMTPTFHGRPDLKKFKKEDTYSLNKTGIWADVSEILSSPNPGQTMILSFHTSHNPVFPGNVSGNVEGFHISIDFATQPDEKHIVKTISYKTRHDGLAILLPPNQGAFEDWGKKIRTYLDYNQARLDAALKAGAIPFAPCYLIPQGNLPQNKGVHSRWYDKECLLIEQKIQALLGQNQLGGSTTQLTAKKWDYWSPELGKIMRKYLESINLHNPLPSGSVGIKVGDEPGILTVKNLAESKNGLKAFAKFLQSRGETLQSLGLKNWNELKPIPFAAVKTAEDKHLFYHQCFFLQESTWKTYREFTRQYKRLRPQAQLGTDACFSGFADAPDYFVEARLGAHDIQKHHYGSGETSTRQIYGNFFIGDMFRSAAKFGKIRTGMLWFVCRLAQERGVHLTGIAAMIRNLQHIYLYGYGPAAMQGENFSDDTYKTDAFAAASRIMRAYAKYERYMVFGTAPEAKAALLLSRGTSIWNGLNVSDATVAFAHADAQQRAGENIVSTQYSNGDTVERAMLLGTLALNGLRCDVLPTEEIRRLKNYKVLYIYESHLERAAGKAILDWVKAGGVLYLGGGAVEKDEYDESFNWLGEIFGTGVFRKTVDGEKSLFPVRGGYNEIYTFGSNYTEENAKELRQLDQVCLSDRKFPVLGLKQNLSLSQGKILGRYTDGTPALVELAVGKGRIILSGMRLGIMLAATATPAFSHRTDFKLPPFTLRNTGASAYWRRTLSPELEALVLYPAKVAKLESNVQIGSSGFDRGTFELPDGSGALFIVGRYTPKNGKVPVSVTLNGDYRRLQQYDGKNVPFKRNGQDYCFELDIDDFAIVEFQK